MEFAIGTLSYIFPLKDVLAHYRMLSMLPRCRVNDGLWTRRKLRENSSDTAPCAAAGITLASNKEAPQELASSHSSPATWADWELSLWALGNWGFYSNIRQTEATEYTASWYDLHMGFMLNIALSQPRCVWLFRLWGQRQYSFVY